MALSSPPSSLLASRIATGLAGIVSLLGIRLEASGFSTQAFSQNYRDRIRHVPSTIIRLSVSDDIVSWFDAIGPFLFYAAVFGLVFAGTGLFIGAFIPFITGDSLVFAAGLVAAANTDSINIFVMVIGVGVAATLLAGTMGVLTSINVRANGCKKLSRGRISFTSATAGGQLLLRDLCPGAG